MKTVAYYDGVFCEIENMKIPALDRAVYFGDGVYDVAYAANGRFSDVDAHITRYFRSCDLLKIAPPVTPEELYALLEKCLGKMDTKGLVQLYWQTSRGVALRGHAFPQGGKSTLLIFARETSLADLRKPFHLITVEDERFYMCHIKSLNILPNVLATQNAKESNCQEAVFHRGSRVTECAHSGLGILKDGVYKTSPLDNMILPSTMRAHTIRVCNRLGIPVKEEPFTLEELFSADEVLVTSSGSLGVYVDQIDGKPVGCKAPELRKAIQTELVNDFEKDTGFRPNILD